MTRPQSIRPVLEPIVGAIRPPGSKSITNRALVCAALAEGTSTLRGALQSEDTEVMIRCLEALGVAVSTDWRQDIVSVEGCSGHLPGTLATLDVVNSGTTIRFLTAAVATATGQFILDGTPRMRQRPIQDLVDALQGLDVEVRCQSGNGCPPVQVDARGLKGGSVAMQGGTSSQYLSGLLMAAPAAQAAVEINLNGPLVSRPYVEMTIKVMQAFGVGVEATGSHCFNVNAPQQYQGQDYAIEPDASAASYFWAAAAITGGTVTVEGLSRSSMQGDVAFCDCLAKMGCDVRYNNDSITVSGNALRGLDLDMTEISDTVQTLAAVALFADGPTTIRGVGHIRHKETDRIGDLATELRKLGAHVAEDGDGLVIEPGELGGAEIDTYDDHRMAMSLALVGLKTPGIVINDPGCTTKTYPAFFTDLKRLTQGQRREGFFSFFRRQILS